MFNVRAQIEKTKKFVKNHPTVTACAVTAVVTAKFTHDKDISRLKNIAAQLLLEEHERDNLLMDLTSFIDTRGLREEFFAFSRIAAVEAE